VHYQGKAGQQLSNGFDNFKMKTLAAGKLVGAVACSYCACQAVAAATLYKLLDLFRIG